MWIWIGFLYILEWIEIFFNHPAKVLIAKNKAIMLNSTYQNKINLFFLLQTVYQIQQVAQPSGQIATSATPVFLTQGPGGGTATVQIQAVSADQQSSTDEEQQS